MIRCTFILMCLTVSLMSMGCCCGPLQCGSGCGFPACGSDCGDPGCNDCGESVCGNMPYSPLDGMRRLKRSIGCGFGCGETYYGEWRSTPPDACDPCCGDQWVGGAVPHRPFCWQPGRLLAGLYGSRFCDGSASTTPCGCGGTCDGSCGNEFAGEFVDEQYSNYGLIETSASSGCASCDARNSLRSTTVTRRVPAKDTITRSARVMNAPINRLR